MLERTLLFLPGIGPVREARLWKRGISHWSDYRALQNVRGVRPRVKAQHDQLLELAERSLGRDPGFFAHILPSPEQWRAYSHFREGAAYLDIETTGDRANLVTIVGIHLRGESRMFVSPHRSDGASATSAIEACGGIVYTPEAVSEFLRSATALVTFNGASFDIPVLESEGVRMPAAPSVDLRVVFHRAGHNGGLKRIEERLGLVRDPSLQGLTGYDAVKLWRRWENGRDRAALELLLAYNAADFENLESLADFACGTLERQLMDQVMTQARLPIGTEPSAPVGQ